MIIGIPKEQKIREDRIAITPEGVKSLVNKNHKILIEHSAGIGSGYSDEDYIQAGGLIVDKVEEVYNQSDMILKVKELRTSELCFLKKNQILVSFMHLAVEKAMTDVLLEKKISSIALETIENDDGIMPLLRPMGEIAGKKVIQIASNLLENKNGGLGILLGGVPGVESSKVLIIGAGNVGFFAAKTACDMGANVSLLDININKLRKAHDLIGQNIKTYVSNEDIIRTLIKEADVVIGAVLIPGHKPPCLISEEMVKSMKKGAVIIDVSIDQGGIVETEDRITTLDDPFYIKFGILHYCVANITASVARTASPALANEILKYIEKIADLGFVEAIKSDKALAKGVNTYNGRLTNKGVALAFGMDYTELPSLIGF